MKLRTKVVLLRILGVWALVASLNAFRRPVTTGGLVFVLIVGVGALVWANVLVGRR